MEADRFVLSTDNLPEKDRFAIWREEFVRRYMALDSEPLAEGTYHGRIEFRLCHPVAIGAVDGSPARFMRTPELMRDGEDAFMLLLCRGGRVQIAQDGVETIAAAGDGAVVDSSVPFRIEAHEFTRTWAIKLARPDLSLLVPGHDDLGGRRIAADNAALRLLYGYLDSYAAVEAMQSTALRRAFGSHVLDLVTLALGPHRDAGVAAERRGGRAARLAAALDMIAGSASEIDLNVSRVAAALGVSVRYVHKLLDSTGLTFSEHVLQQRLNHARRLLCDPRFAHRKISEIALEAGFADLSYFNRSFRRHVGATPSDVRAAALRAEE